MLNVNFSSLILILMQFQPTMELLVTLIINQSNSSVYYESLFPPLNKN